EPPQWAVVLGASGRVQADVRLDACRADGIPLSRRSSGGGTVVVGPGSVNLTVVLPRGYDPSLETVEGAQSFVLERCAQSIRNQVPGVHVLGSGDLTIDARKFAGSAQRRLKRSVLVHASLLNAFALEKIDRYLNQPGRQPVYREDRPHSRFVRNLGLPHEALRERLLAAWEPAHGFHPYERPPLHRIPALMEERFADPAWVERF
ncbi:MAG TPA: lipoate--protein ligase family protein, partial [Isosphaeraceae bacterium]|nr:lipoate--protein ligase family protein [Isosphaeraceae bacterium]